jgi:hypothetical protein
MSSQIAGFFALCITIALVAGCRESARPTIAMTSEESTSEPGAAPVKGELVFEAHKTVLDKKAASEVFEIIEAIRKRKDLARLEQPKRGGPFRPVPEAIFWFSFEGKAGGQELITSQFGLFLYPSDSGMMSLPDGSLRKFDRDTKEKLLRICRELTKDQNKTDEIDP